jgi:hypothetical protein
MTKRLTVTQQKALLDLQRGAVIIKARRHDRYELWQDGVYLRAVLKTTFDALSEAGYIQREVARRYIYKPYTQK